MFEHVARRLQCPYLDVVKSAAFFLIESELCQSGAGIRYYLRAISALVPSCFRDTGLGRTKQDRPRDSGLEPIISVDRAPRLVDPLFRNPLRKRDERLLCAFASHVGLKIETALDLRQIGLRDHLPPGIDEQELIAFRCGEPRLVVQVLASR